jgi:hypothetical protein
MSSSPPCRAVMEHTHTRIKEFKPFEKKIVHILHLHFRKNPQTFFFFYEEVVTMMMLMKMRKTAMVTMIMLMKMRAMATVMKTTQKLLTYPFQI